MFINIFIILPINISESKKSWRQIPLVCLGHKILLAEIQF